MAHITNRHQPSFILWPLQNARTAYAPTNLPILLVVPHRRYKDGQPVPDSQVKNVFYSIEDAPGRAKVAGYQYRGIYVPQLERYRINILDSDLPRYRIYMPSQRFLRKDATGPITYPDGQYSEIDYSEAGIGDYFEYVTVRGEIKDKAEYLPDADYYDFSSVAIETEGLKPLGKYVFAWHADYYRRIVTPNDELHCIDTSYNSLARLGIVFDHPGDIHQEMFEKTPSFIFNNSDKPLYADDTFKFYRPFADVLNDIFDESSFLETVNHIDKIPAAYLPYLSYLLGWEMRYSSRTTDDTRRRALKNARRLQALKGSRRAIRDLFEIFEYTIETINLWYRPDGEGFVGPDDYIKPEWDIEVKPVCRTDPILSNYSTPGWGEIDLPLLHRPNGNMTVEAWLVKTSSPLYAALMAKADSYDTLEAEGRCAVSPAGYLINVALHDNSLQGTFKNYSRVLVNQTTSRGISEESTVGGPLSMTGVKYDSYYNRLNITFDRYLEYDDEKLFVFVTYEYDKNIIPDQLRDFRSNRFDIRILERTVSGNLFEQPDPQSLEFLIKLVFQLKAFHSLLRKIMFTVTLSDVYAVTDVCVGGDNIQRAGTDMGEYQVPPAIIPTETSETVCGDLNVTRGFKASDFEYRSAVLSGLEEEFLMWKALDGKYDVENRALYDSISRVEIPSTDGTGACWWNERGQDRRFSSTVDIDQEGDVRTRACDVSATTQDYCYKGRVTSELIQSYAIPLDESYRSSLCLTQGSGFYFSIPYISESWCAAGTGCIEPDNLQAMRKSHLERMLARVLAFRGANLKYTDQPYLDDSMLDNKAKWAISRPNLGIEKDNLFIPGHRPITANKLPADFTHPIYNARPWDDNYMPDCIKSSTPVLASALIVNTNGDEELVVDTQPLIYQGNSLTPDVSNYGDHGSTDPILVTHKILTTAPKSEYVELDGVVHIEDVATSTTDTVCLPSQVGKIFKSAVDA